MNIKLTLPASSAAQPASEASQANPPHIPSRMNEAYEIPLFATPEQKEAILTISSLNESIIIQAVAGSGKSWTLIETIKYMVYVNKVPQQDIAIMVFNKSIKDELKYKLTAAGLAQVSVNTRHGYGLEAIRRLQARINVNPNKTRDIAKQVIQYFGKPFSCIAPVSKLVGLAKDAGIGWNTDITDRNAWYDLYKKHDIEIEEDYSLDDLIKHSIEVLRKSNEFIDECDFPDMVYWPLLKGLTMPTQFRCLLLDEAQDTNVTGRGLAKALIRVGGILAAVGDDWQAIYGFAGADNDSLDLIKHEFSAKELWLTVCFRCSKAVIKHAQKWMPKIQHAADAVEGSVTEVSYDDFLKLTPSNTSAILCRKNAPLMSLAFSYLRRGIACRIEGRDIGQNLIKLCKKWKARSLLELSNRLESHREKETQKFMANGQEQQADQLNDQLDCLLSLLDRAREVDNSIEGLIRLIESMFTDSVTGQPQRVLTLSSVHKAKGREWPTVYLLSRDTLMPSKFARQDWQREQELHLIYVAVTRAKADLIEILSPEKESL
jgi:superfamily I DNA/RNA helicase